LETTEHACIEFSTDLIHPDHQYERKKFGGSSKFAIGSL
jgi:hypothetical protein